MEKQKFSNESVADIKAAEKMAKLFDAIKAHNAEFIERNPHAMNVFPASDDRGRSTPSLAKD